GRFKLDKSGSTIEPRRKRECGFEHTCCRTGAARAGRSGRRAGETVNGAEDPSKRARSARRLPAGRPRAPARAWPVEYDYDAADAILLGRKDDVRRRGLASPDDADVLALTFARRCS